MAEVTYLKPLPKSLPLMLDMIVSIPVNIIRVLLFKADVYIGIKPFPSITLPLIMKKILGRGKIVVDIDDLDSGYRKGLASTISALVQRPFPRCFDLVTYHNKRLRPYIQKTFSVDEDRLYRLEQGVDMSIFYPREPVPDMRNMFPVNKKIILYAGHLNVASDLEDIMQAMGTVLSRVEATFIVAGGGPEESRFRRLACETGIPVFFTGQLDNTEIADYMSIADICLVYYRDIRANHYRSSMKLREYLAMNKRVVTDDVGELQDFKRFTYQIPPNVKEYAEKIIEVLATPPDKREESGGDYVRSLYDWESLGKGLYERLKSMLSAPDYPNLP